jgi:hypothetical protein
MRSRRVPRARGQKSCATWRRRPSAASRAHFRRAPLSPANIKRIQKVAPSGAGDSMRAAAAHSGAPSSAGAARDQTGAGRDKHRLAISERAAPILFCRRPSTRAADSVVDCAAPSPPPRLHFGAAGPSGAADLLFIAGAARDIDRHRRGSIGQMPGGRSRDGRARPTAAVTAESSCRDLGGGRACLSSQHS